MRIRFAVWMGVVFLVGFTSGAYFLQFHRQASVGTSGDRVEETNRQVIRKLAKDVRRLKVARKDLLALIEEERAEHAAETKALEDETVRLKASMEGMDDTMSEAELALKRYVKDYEAEKKRAEKLEDAYRAKKDLADRYKERVARNEKRLNKLRMDAGREWKKYSDEKRAMQIRIKQLEQYVDDLQDHIKMIR
jgi:chromosome segregation ATPase